MTIVEKIVSKHAGRNAKPGDIVDVGIDARIARDFGGANVVKNIRDHGLAIDDPSKTFFTFDCNPGGSDQKYAENQQICRIFARQTGIKVYDINAGIGTHIAIEQGLVGPGQILVSTDSHANIMGAIGAFGQGMGDQDIAHAFAKGKVWFKTPATVRVQLRGMPSANAGAKDIALAMCKHFGANGLLGVAAEFYGPYIDTLDVAGRMTLSSMCTEMGGIIIIFPPNKDVIAFCERVANRKVEPVYADADAEYADSIEIDISDLQPMIARPAHPDDVVPVSEVSGTKVDSVFIGSCTNGRYEDFLAAAQVLKERHVAPGVVLKIVPATDAIWQRMLDDGLVSIFKEAGALLSNAGCAGCAAGQVGQNGPGEITVSTGNRNFPGKQGKGSVYLASPETAAASAIAGVIATCDAIPDKPVEYAVAAAEKAAATSCCSCTCSSSAVPTKVRGRCWVINKDNIDTDMIYHNRYLTITDPAQMGQYTFDNLEGWEDFAKKCQPGDIVITGKNFGCGSSRQQAVDCFKTLGVSVLIAESFGAIYERNAINAGMPIMYSPVAASGIKDGEEVDVDFTTGVLKRANGSAVSGTPFSDAQLAIYLRGGLLSAG